VKPNSSGKFIEYEQYYYGSVSLTELKNELEVQILHFPISAVNALDHMSCHHGFLSIFSDFFKSFLGIAINYNVPIRNPVSQPHANQRFPTIKDETRWHDNSSEAA